MPPVVRPTLTENFLQGNEEIYQSQDKMRKAIELIWTQTQIQKNQELMK